jgi:uncharacterized UBP type Zn finger protein
MPCDHIEHVDVVDGVIGLAPTSDGCVDCLAIGGSWLHLRRCLQCGHVGCCDSSPNRHATAHAGTSGHPLVQSFEPGEEWVWCYVDNEAFELDDLPVSPAHG